MSCKCYDVDFVLRAVGAAGWKSNETTVREFNGDVQRIQEWRSQKEKLNVLKKSGKTRSPSLYRHDDP